MEQPTLGQYIKATDRMYRQTSGQYGNTKTWIRFGEFFPGGPKPVEGTFIGSRTIQDGKREWGGEDCGNVWFPSNYKEAWLIVANPRCNPIRVFPEDVSWS